MTNIRIVICKSDLESDAAFQKLLAERQSAGIIEVQRVEITDYKVMPPLKKSGQCRKTPRPEDFVSAVKFIVRHAAQQNDKPMNMIVDGIPRTYHFWLDDAKWCEVMDCLLAEHRDVIESALEHKQRADSVNLLAPYIGEIIGMKLFQKRPGIQKIDMLKSFTAYYGEVKSSAQTKLSTSYPSRHEFNELVDKTFNLAKDLCK